MSRKCAPDCTCGRHAGQGGRTGKRGSHLTNDDRQRIMEMHEDGLSHRKIAEVIDTSPSNVGRIIRQGGGYLRGRPVAPEGQRWCYKCKTFKEVSEFWRHAGSKDGLCGACKTCMASLHSDNRSAMRYRAARVYGITLEEYDALRADQICCPICGDDGVTDLDHDSRTGKLREFLCAPCNRGLGLFKHSPDILRYAAEYLERHE